MPVTEVHNPNTKYDTPKSQTLTYHLTVSMLNFLKPGTMALPLPCNPFSNTHSYMLLHNQIL